MKKTVFKIIGIILTVLWGAAMFWSTAFVSVYVLVAVAAICAILFDRSEFKKHKFLPVFTGIILSGAVILANYGLFGSIFHNKILILLSAFITFIGGFAAFFSITKWVVGITSSGKGLARKQHRPKAGLFFWIPAAIIAAIDITVLILAFYPGIISPDSVDQIEQIVTGVYSNHHPVVHTMLIKLCIWAGSSIFGTVNAGVFTYSIFQILIMAVSFAYVIMTLYQMQISFKVIIPFFLAYALLPYNIFYSFTMWKDVLFGAAVAAFLTALLRIIRGIGKGKAANFIVLAISSAGVCLLRSNGWMAFAVILVIGIFVLGRKHIKTIIIMAVVFIAAMAVRGPLFNALGIAKPDILESLAIPMQQIARVLSEGEEITDEQRETLSNIANLDMIAEKYRWDTVDTFKNDIRNTGDVGYIEEHKKELLGLYIEMAKQHPVTFVEAWIDQTKGYWNGGYEFWNWTVVNENRFGIERVTKDRKAEQILTSYADSFNRIYPLQLFISIGLCTWMTVMLAAGGIAGRRKEALLTVPGIVLVLTLMIATPISCEFRYAYALFTAFPAIFCGIMQKR